jgi:WD40 repeat protein
VAVVSSTLLLYATNAGAVRAVDVSSPQAPRWSPELFSTNGAAVLCLRVAPPQACPAGVAARVLIGDMAGFATVLDVHAASSDGYEGRVPARWLAHDRGRTLAVFWLHTAAGHLPATADALGALKVWRLEGSEAQVLAHTQLKFRVSSAAAQPPDDARSSTTILCGDQNGNVFAFGLPSDCGELAALGSVAHAHAAAIVTFAGCTAHDAVTAGGDGYVCSFAVLPSGGLARTRRLHVAAITAIEALQDDDLAVAGSTCIAAGVTSGDAVVMDVRNACELLRVPCGGWRKPHAFLLGPAGRFIVASVRDGSVHLHRRWPEGTVGAGGPDAHRSLRASHHGREIHAAVLVPAPEHGRCALITGAEDGTLFRLYFDSSAALALDGAALMAQTAGGTAVRALSLLHAADGRWLLVSAGAKEVLMCWALAWTAAGELTAQLLAAHSRPDDAFHRAWRSSADMPAEATGGDQRYMSVCAFVVAGELFAVASSSDGTLLMWAMSLSKAARWRFVAVLHSGSCPVLALDCATAADGGVWLFSGATDGTVAVWDASPAVRHAVAAPDEAPGVLPELAPSLVLQHAHQSGVNSLRIACQPAATADAWVLVSGGDDQAVNAVALELTPVCRVLAAVRRPGAHASGVKGVWTDGAAVHTVSLDQRVRSWRLGAASGHAACADAHLDAPWLARLGDPEDNALGSRVDMQRWWACRDEQCISFDLAGSSVTEVPDVETLAALPLASGCVIAVAGRGVQLFA